MTRTPWRLPNAVIYLQAVFRPSLLRPHIYTPGLADVSWRRLREEGYNAVVIDKDNCLTWPNRDELHADVELGWNDLKAVFGPTNVLVVSNSAGTNKDPGGIAAESVSRRLGVPVLIHRQSKPGCAAQIMDYFIGKSEIRKVSRTAQEISIQGEEVIQQAEDAFREADEEEREASSKQQLPIRSNEDLRLVVVGDRLATDVLLARRLDKHIQSRQAIAGSSTTTIPGALSIVTTRLFKRNDVVPLRWLESAWSRLGLRKGAHGTIGGEGGEEWAATRFLVAHDRTTALDSSPSAASRSKRVLAVLRSGVMAIPAGWRSLRHGIAYIRNHPPRIPTRDEARRGALVALRWSGRNLRMLLFATWRLVRSGSGRAGRRLVEAVRTARAKRVTVRS